MAALSTQRRTLALALVLLALARGLAAVRPPGPGDVQDVASAAATDHEIFDAAYAQSQASLGLGTASAAATDHENFDAAYAQTPAYRGLLSAAFNQAASHNDDEPMLDQVPHGNSDHGPFFGAPTRELWPRYN